MSSPSSFVHLHNHTTYSLLDGAQKIDEMCARAAADGQTAIAITDHGNLFGALSFARTAARHGIRPILGLEAYVAPGSRFDRQAQPVEGIGRKNYYHLVLLAENYTGYKNLIKLSTAGYLEGFYYRPRIDHELLAQHSEGLICLSACLAGELATHLQHGQYERARQRAGEMRDLFGAGRYWIELQDHGLEAQQQVNAGAVRLAADLGVGTVATNDCHYLLPADHAAHDVLICIQTGKTVNTRSGMTYTPEHYLKTQAEMQERFAAQPEAVANTLAVAERCRVAFEPPTLQLPEFPVPPGYDLDRYLEHVAREGLARRLGQLAPLAAAGALRHPPEAYRERLELELKIIREMGFAGYFLITWDFIRYARESQIPVGPGRGSAAGSLVAYAVRITDIDPMQFGLLFERFLNPERVTMPDIDIDFCFRKREQVIDYVTHKYGRDNVAQIITFGTLAARAAIRDVGRALEVPYDEVDRIAKLVPAIPGQEITIDQALADVPALRQTYEQSEPVREMLDLARRLEGLTRHASTHAAGVVIAPRPIVEFAPLYRGTKEGDEITTQYAKDEIEEIGLLKLDFLGLKTLTLIDDALASIGLATGVRPDLPAVPFDDPAVFELFSRGRTTGIFQFESSGMRDILRRFKPERFEDLVALNALYRPGPLGGGLVDDFIKRRHGQVQVSYPHPQVESILRETYGVIVYQEQVMQIASTLAGYSLGEADILRRAMGKKQKEVMRSEQKRFIEGAARRDIPRAIAKSVFELMAHFAGYGFNKSHSAAYALVAYHTAWLKVHHPVHFMAALLTTEKTNTDKLVQYIGECRQMGLDVKPPDINASHLDFTVDGPAIRFGLSAIRNVGEGAIRSILAARDAAGAFGSVHDVCAVVDARLVNKRVLEALVQSGAMDRFGARRSQLFAALDAAIELGQKQRADREAGQAHLFGGPTDSAPPRLPDLPEWDDATRLGHEKAALGFYVSGHPLDAYRNLLRGLEHETTASVRGLAGGRTVRLAGIATNVNRKRSRRGEMWATLLLEDLEGAIEVLVFPKTYRSTQSVLHDDRATLVTGRLEVDEDRVRVLAESFRPLDELGQDATEAVRLLLDAERLDEELVARLSGTLRAHRGAAPLVLEIQKLGAFRLVARSALQVRPSDGLSRDLESLLGPDRIRYDLRAPAAPADS